MAAASPTLFITNGQSAVATLQHAGFTGEFVSWDDVLHDGPVPTQQPAERLLEARAAFIAACGWAEKENVRARFEQRDGMLTNAALYDEVVLWFEHDLYDQLQLLQILDRLAGLDLTTPVSLICKAEFVSESSPERLRALHQNRPLVMPDQYALAQVAWQALGADTPEPLAAVLDADTTALPFLHAALHRLAEEYPHPKNGLSRTEQQILDAVAAGAHAPGALFQATQAQEDAKFMGDASFWLRLAALTQGPHPLLHTTDHTPFQSPPLGKPPAAFLNQRLYLTKAGQAVLECTADATHLNGIDRWVGGVHLQGTSAWRWNGAAFVNDEPPTADS